MKVRSRLRRAILQAEKHMRRLWGALALSLALAAYGLSGLPGHELVALSACIPLVLAWRRRWRTQATVTARGLEAILDAGTDGLVVIDADGKIVLCNRVFADLASKPPRDLVGLALRAVAGDRKLLPAVSQALAGESPVLCQVHMGRVALHASACPIRHDGRIIGALIVLRAMYPSIYEYRESPLPRPRSTVSLSDLLGWFFPSDSYRPKHPEISPVVYKCLNDPSQTGSQGLSGSAEPETGRALYALVRLIEPKNVIEIGSYVGASSICIAQALADNPQPGLLHCVEVEERHVTLTGDHLAEASLADRARIYHGSSQDPGIVSSLPRSELIFVDGDHTYEGAKKDFQTYSGLLVGEGMMVYHDTVKIMALQRLMDELAQDPRHDTFTIATSDGDGLTLIRRRAAGTE
jgi:predicted O-methyltransferase YrrM/PAS domain-containing protein